MASSEVEVVSSSSPFGCVLKDHNLRDHRSSAAASATATSSKCQPNLQKTLKELVRDHLRSSVSNSPSSITVSNENCNSNNHNQSFASPAHYGNASRTTHQHRGRNPSHKLNHVEETPSMSRRQARVLDRWATQQAKGMISTIEKQGNQAEVSALSKSIPVSSKSGRDSSPVPSDSSSVSSLVQRWRGIETSDPKQPPHSPHSPTSNNQNPNPSSGFDSESISDWESDRGSPTGCVNGDRNIQNGADGEKKEKSRLADIIRKLPLVTPMGQSRHGLPESGEAAVLCSPRIRGRQAISDLLSRQVHDRYSEIEALGDGQPVTKFPKRNRLQTFLKLRLLRRENSAQNDSHRQHRKSFESSKCRLSTVTSLRRRFSTGVAEQEDYVEEASISDHSSSVADEETNDKDREEIVQSTVNDAASQPNLEEEIRDSQPNLEEEIRDSCATKTLESRIHQEEEVELRNTSVTSASDDHHNELKGNTGMARNNNHRKEDHEEETPGSSVSWPEPHRDDDHVPSCSPGTTDSLSCNIWEEDEDEEGYNNGDHYEPNLDWIFDIARPRSYWESRRQARYQEIFERSSNDDIRQLIQRKSVSVALASDFRATMDELIMSSVQVQMHTSGSQEDEDGSMVAFLRRQMQSALSNSEKEQLEQTRSRGSVAAVLASGFRDRLDQLMVSRGQSQGRTQPLTGNAETVPQQLERREQEHMEPIEERMQMHVEECITKENEQETPSSQHCNDGSSYYEQSPSSQLPWSSYEDCEDVDDLEQMDSAPIRRESSITTNSYDDSPLGPSMKNSSTYEMELICDLRVQMEQIYREMAELRKSVNKSMNTQSDLRSIIREEVSAAMSGLKGKESGRKPNKEFCCVCNEKKADTLLYRCGHLCSCFECAQELQWSSGKCPICWAQIEDVVRVNTDY